ncbi:MAG: MipA/OmpV family protein [Burkholderiales bacterium]
MFSNPLTEGAAFREQAATQHGAGARRLPRTSVENRQYKFGFRALLSTVLGAACALAGAAELPLWEAGAGVAVIDFPDYRGSDQRETFVLPLPYFIYRGNVIKADRSGLRGEFLKHERLNLYLGINGTIPVDSADNVARQGMPDLDPTLEIGPILEIHLGQSQDRRVRADLRLQLRTVVATDFSDVQGAGWIFQPKLNLDLQDIWPGPGWRIGLATSPLFGSHRYHEYFYGVAPEFATAQRPAYAAPGGYAGWEWVTTLSKRFPSYWVGGFLRADTLAGAVFDASPLLRQNYSYAVGFGVAWIFTRSEKQGTADE